MTHKLKIIMDAECDRESGTLHWDRVQVFVDGQRLTTLPDALRRHFSTFTGVAEAAMKSLPEVQQPRRLNPEGTS